MQGSFPKIKVPRRNVVIGSLRLLWRDKLAFVSFLYLILLFIAAWLAPSYVGDQINKVDFDSSMLPPSLEPGGRIFGTDPLGKDLLVLILIASRVSLFISLIVVIGSSLLGLFLGLLAGYYGGLLDDMIMRYVDLMMAFPSLLLVLVVIFIARPGIDKVIVILIATGWPVYARVVRAETMRLREFQFIDAARALGGGDLHILIRHIAPNLVSVMSVLATLGFVGVIMTESGLSFLGMGIQPPDVSWGLLVAQGRAYLASAWWLAFFPGAAIFVTATAFSLLSNWVSVVVDPVQRLQLLNIMQKRSSVSHPVQETADEL
ncbi:MAG: ABC transporter permease [Chloroflexi bacterium]|nr:ABC transporter permease [Chloroflexota bacterium]